MDVIDNCGSCDVNNLDEVIDTEIWFYNYVSGKFPNPLSDENAIART